MLRERRWTQSAINDLRAGMNGGLSLESVADVLQRTSEDVSQMMVRLGMKSVGAER